MKGKLMSTYAKMKKTYDDARPNFWRNEVGTGYFATYIGALNERHSLVHLIHGRNPICGSKLSYDMIYAMNSAGVHMPYVECEHCKRIYKRENPNG
jgi:hypothetical protein